MAVSAYVVSPRASSTPSAEMPAPVSEAEALQTLRSLDADRLRLLMARGWDAKTLFGERNGAINVALEACEWDPGHDPQKLVLVIRMLMDAGEPLDSVNIWGDTPYSIAKSPRYCGPDHPATRMIHAMCYSAAKASLGDKCHATYERSRR